MSMRILGIRSTADVIRYAVVEVNGSSITLVNTTTESKLPFPATARTPTEKLLWFEQELTRILRNEPEVKKIGIKINELARGGLRGETLASREAAYLDAAALLFAARTNLPAQTFLYSNLGTSSKEVKAHSESRGGRTTKYWDAQMADAIAAAVHIAKL